MHQKNNQAAQSSSSASRDDDPDDNPSDPFADTEEDLDDDDDSAQDARGSWWRGVVRRKDKPDPNDSDDEPNSDDDEFGDFAMAEDDNDGKVVLRPLAVNPAKEGSRGLSGLWRFGLSKVEKEKEFLHDDKPGFDDDFASFDEKPEEEGKRAIEVKEAKRRTSIEDPDDEEVVV